MVSVFPLALAIILSCLCATINGAFRFELKVGDNFTISYPSKGEQVPEQSVSEEFVNRIRDAGYPAEVHAVTTEDGYIIRMLRIPYSATTKDTPRKPLFLMHPFAESSHAWIVQGPGKALAYLLADAGYDVWMGNARGTEMSRDHVKLNPDSSKYWDFSWQDIGEKDLPAFIDYVLDYTNAPKLNYVGFSQGTTVFFVMTSTRPEYNKKIDQAILMAPAALLRNTDNTFYKILGKFSSEVSMMGQTTGLSKITTQNIQYVKKLEFFCRIIKPADSCNFNEWFIQLDGVDPAIRPSILKHVPAGISLKQIVHFAQMIKKGRFQKYDYDLLNLLHYGQFKPPMFDLKQITANIKMYFSTQDKTTTYKDVLKLKSLLPNVKSMYAVSNFKHTDFIYSDKAVDLVYKKVISDMLLDDQNKSSVWRD